MAEPTAPRPVPDIAVRSPTMTDDRSSAAATARPAAQGQDSALAICRICRGEATPEEPLFYPCKCSGSIKYVHQDCLMEWLSHSQKKYCELCKTSFRFTKLYAPDMPKSLPFRVFVQHMARYAIRNTVVWARALLAVGVWACLLPYFMRIVWSFLFWVSDEGFGSRSMLARVNDTAGATIELSSAFLGMGSCPASPLLQSTTSSSAAPAEVLLSGVSGQNISEFLMRMLFGFAGMPLKFGRLESDRNATAPANGTLADGLSSSEHTLLGDSAFLRNLTPSQTLNRYVISILEGQIITVLVIVCFILIILVRDYVVQQQPEIIMRAAFGGEPGQARLRQALVDPAAAPNEDAIAPLPAPADEHEHSDSDADTLEEDDAPGSPTQMPGPFQPNSNESHNPFASPRDEHAEEPLLGLPSPLSDNSSEGDAQVTEDTSAREQASVGDYMRIFRRAGGDSAKILQIIEDEGLQEKLSYWIEVTRRNIQNAEEAAGPSARTEPERGATPPSGEGSSSTALTPSASEESVRAGDVDVPGRVEAAGDKGKEPWRPRSPTLSPLPAPSHHQRQRSISDGPQPSSLAQALGNNTWSFEELPELLSDQSRSRQHNASPPSSIFVEGETPDSAWTSVNDDPSDREVEDHSDEEGSTAEHDGGLPGDSRMVAERLAAQDLAGAGEHIPDAELEHIEGAEGGEPRVAPEAGEPAAALPEDANILHRTANRVGNFMFGGLEEQHFIEVAAAADLEDEEIIVDEQWVDDMMDPAAANAADPGAAELDVAGAEAGLDPEAIEDLEDFEGVMELIGMRGPLAGLFQNAIFCAVLVSVTVFACIFFPYNIGRLSIWATANPMRLVRMLFEISKLVQDAVICAFGLISWFFINVAEIFLSVFGGRIAAAVLAARKASWSLWTGAGSRVAECIFLDLPMSASEIQNFSAVSHDALLTIKSTVNGAISLVIGEIWKLLTGEITVGAVVEASHATIDFFTNLAKSLTDPNSWVIDFKDFEQAKVIDPALASWSGWDRFWAISAGYTTVLVTGALYLKHGAQLTRGTVLHYWELGFIETLHQASGIIKVILIISIEMLVFPLYCGLLLDAALLPLFGGATFASRTAWTFNYPLTSIFVHWFVGTGYMFHFALFVSMCRKIMRPGVLYFIRDPDDPEFHPVRDVLERNLTTQLRKILFSAFVYGALVIVCLGGVVWGLSWSLPSVLPIHYSSNEPVLEFPVDLLFYNFLMPVAVKFFKPSDGLHVMYTWWFRKCARGLHLTFFLFGERQIDEEGTLQLAPESPHRQSPAYRQAFLELSGKNDVQPKTWDDTFVGGSAKPRGPLKTSKMQALTQKKEELVATKQLATDGHFVRAPASDRVKIPKGQRVFLPVDEQNQRSDKQADLGLYSSPQYQVVYIPPNFRARVFLFILYIWIFAAVTGVGLTIIPLMVGRTIFKSLIPEYVRTNDIYAFSIGIYLLGSIAYALYNGRHFWNKAQEHLSKARAAFGEGSAGGPVLATVMQVAKLAYVYFCVIVLIPLVLSGLVELYFMVPMHTYLHPPTAASIQAEAGKTDVNGRHTFRIMQAWTLGLLYMKLLTKVITIGYRQSRLSVAVHAVFRSGWLHPDANVLTRAFVIPGLVIGILGVWGPPLAASWLIRLYTQHKYASGERPVGTEAEEAAWAATTAILYRASYPAAACCAMAARNAALSVLTLKSWSARVRDEAYLIGERLHNFGVVSDNSKKGRAAWRARGARL